MRHPYTNIFDAIRARAKKGGKRANIDKIIGKKVSELDSRDIIAGDAATAAFLKKIASTDVRDFTRLRKQGPSDEIAKLISSRMQALAVGLRQSVVFASHELIYENVFPDIKSIHT